MIEGRKTYFIRAREARPHQRYTGEIVFLIKDSPSGPGITRQHFWRLKAPVSASNLSAPLGKAGSL